MLDINIYLNEKYFQNSSHCWLPLKTNSDLFHLLWVGLIPRWSGGNPYIYIYKVFILHFTALEIDYMVIRIQIQHNS
jgi:hypothetical protein